MFGRAVALSAVLLACGGGKPTPTPPAPPSDAAVPSDAGAASDAVPDDAAAVAEAELATRSEEGIAAAGAAFAYIHAVSVRDWAGACAVLRRAERDKQARRAGSCTRGLAAQFDAAHVTALATAATGAVRKRGHTMAVDIIQGNEAKPIMTVYLQREDALWLLVSLPDGDAF